MTEASKHAEQLALKQNQVEECIDTLEQLNRDLKMLQKRIDDAIQAQASARQLSSRTGQTLSEDKEFQESDTS